MTKPLDASYLDAALRRAGRGVVDHAEPIAVEPLTGGRTGMEVLRLRCRNASYVVKTVPATNWRGEGTGRADGGEPRLWLWGIAKHLAPSVRWPVVDVSLEAESNSYRILMEDVGAGIRDRGRFALSDSRELLRALARMHAAAFESEWLASAPVPSVVGTVRVLLEPILYAAGVQHDVAPWATEVLRDFPVINAFLPGFLDVLGPRAADDYLALVADQRWQARLGRSRATLLHGDLRRANISFENDCVALIDWEFAAAGPPACDLQWHVFVNYWAYPPDGVNPGDHRDDLRDSYANAFEEALGRRVDRAQFLEDWGLGWIKTVTSLGFLLYDALPSNGGTPEQRAAVQDLATRAIRRAIDMRESLG